MLDSLIKLFFISMPFAPLWGYIVRGVYELKVAVMTLYGVFSVLLFFLLLLIKGGRNIHFPKYLVPLVMLSIYYFIWDFFNGNVAENGIITSLLRNYHIFTITTILLIVNTSFSDNFIINLLFLLKVTVIPAVIVSLIQATVDPFFLTPESYLLENAAYLGNIYEMRPPSIFGYLDANDYGVSFVPILSIILSYYLITLKHRLLTVILMFGGALVCVISNGRYVMVNYCIILSQAITLRSISFRKTLTYIGVMGIGILLTAIVLIDFVGYDLNTYIHERILSESGQTRILAFKLLYDFFPANPIFGNGVRVTPELGAEIKYLTSQIHVGYLSVIFEYGILGGALTFLFWYKLAAHFYRNASKTHYWGAFFGFIPFLVANALMVQYYIYFYGIMLLFIFDSYFMDIIKEASEPKSLLTLNST